MKIFRTLEEATQIDDKEERDTGLSNVKIIKVCSLLEWCFIISIDTCRDWFQCTYNVRMYLSPHRRIYNRIG